MNRAGRAGDGGMTSLNGNSMVAKSDERIVLIGTIDELSCHIRILKTERWAADLTETLDRIQSTLSHISDGIRIGYAREAVPALDEIAFLEQEIKQLLEQSEEMEPESLADTKERAVFELAAAVTRRAERALIAVDRRFGVRAESRQYLNRLADFFDQAALCYAGNSEKTVSFGLQDQLRQTVNQVISEMGIACEITLQEAKVIIEETERESKRREKRSVICICNAHGNVVAIHVMDGAFLVSFDAAQKKAYTAAALQMPTMEVAKLAQPGETFYGVDRLDDGKITLIGGGRPLLRNGVLCGAVGISGGTGEEDDSLAAYAVKIYEGR